MRLFFLAMIVCFFGNFGYAKTSSYETKAEPNERTMEISDAERKIPSLDQRLEIDRFGYFYENGKIFFMIRSNMSPGYLSHSVENADLKTFEILSDEDYAKDKNNVYYHGEKLNGIDSKNFTIMKSGNEIFTKDKNGVYYQNEKLDGMDSKSFEILKENYFKDKNGLYDRSLGYEKIVISGAVIDLASIQITFSTTVTLF